MSAPGLMNKPVTLVYKTASGEDNYGQPIVSTVMLEGSCYYQRLSTDDVDALSREQIDFKVYLPIGTDVDGLIAVVMDSARYEMQGPSHKQWNPRLGRDIYWVVNARRAV